MEIILSLDVVIQGKKFTEYLARLISQEKEINHLQIGKEIKLFLFSYYTIMYMENLGNLSKIIITNR